MNLKPLLLASALALGASLGLPAKVLAATEGSSGVEGLPQERAQYLRSHYVKTEARIPMRDGRRLFTSIYVPLDASNSNTYPFLLHRTPYSAAPYGASAMPQRLGPTEAFEKDGYIFVVQDVRGRHMSEGEFDNMRPIVSDHDPKAVDEATDTFDTIAWLLKNVAHHNGKVGQWGNSYPGFYTAAGAVNSHPALKAISPQAPIANWWQGDDMHRHGAFNLQMAFGFFAGFGRARPVPTERFGWGQLVYGTPDAYDYFLKLGPLANAKSRFPEPIAYWDTITAHPNYDAYWQARDLPPRLVGIKPAVLTVGGWYDTEDLYGPLHIYSAIEKQNPGTTNTLMIGPWTHGNWNRGGNASVGDADFGFDTAKLYKDTIAAFFKHHLKGGPNPSLPEARMFETGANRWRSFAQWPPAHSRPQALYLHAGGKLGFSAPAAGASAAPYSEFLSDPAKPVPYTTEISNQWSRDYAAADQRFAASRPDVLVFESEPLTEDVTLAGPLRAELFVSTTGSDADWIVKLIDVNPGVMPGEASEDAKGDSRPSRPRGGQQTLVRGEPFRGRFRESDSNPKAFTPGEVTPVAFGINDVLHTFQRGHRIMVQIQSTWFPFIDRNPQTFVPNIFEAEAADFTKATHRVYHAAAHASRLQVQVLAP